MGPEPSLLGEATHICSDWCAATEAPPSGSFDAPRIVHQQHEQLVHKIALQEGYYGQH